MANTDIERLVRATLELYAEQPVDVRLLAVGEVLARLLAALEADPEEGIAIVTRVARQWLGSGLLPTRAPFTVVVTRMRFH